MGVLCHETNRVEAYVSARDVMEGRFSLIFNDDLRCSVNISTQTISRFLHSAECHLPTYTSYIDYHIKVILKVNTKKIDTNDKFMHFRWIAWIIDERREEAP